MADMQRVVLLGRGGAGKSTFARKLSGITGIPAVELDKHFWSDVLEPPGPEEWTARQAALVAADRWILDGDLGPHDVLEPRLRHADAVVVLDYSLARAAWRAARRSRERADFWRWLWHYRRRSRPRIRSALAAHASGAAIHWLSTPRQARQLLARVSAGH